MEIINLLIQISSKNFFLAIIASLINGICSAGIVALINYVIAGLPNTSGYLLWLFIGLCTLLWLSRLVSWVIITQLSQQIVYKLRLEIIQSILNCPLQHLENIGTPKLFATLTEDIGAIAGASIQLSSILVNLGVLIGVFVYLLWLSPFLFFIVLFTMMIGYKMNALIQQKGSQAFNQGRLVYDILFQHFRSVTEGIKELKLHRLKKNAFILEDLIPTAQEAKKNIVKAMTFYGIAASTSIILFFFPLGLILFAFPQIKTISSTTISSYALGLLYVINPIKGVVNSLPQVDKANISLDKIKSLGLSLTELVTEEDFPVGSDFDRDWSSLEFVNLNYSYRDEKEAYKFALKEINLKFKPGEIVFIVGGNGSGKSTLIKLITGLYNPDLGKVLFNNQLVTDHNREWYRQQFSVVFYDFYLFDRLIGIDSRSNQEIQNYLALLEIDHKVKITEGVFSTTNLSQGQRKRLALLVAYLEDRPIYVFDEWTSDQDPVFKAIFYEKLLPALKSKGKTVIAISHDDQYFEKCDRLIKLDYGRIV